jgi:diaminopimelate epimerase
MGDDDFSFHKYEGLGNDFILVDLSDERDLPPERAAGLCERRYGIGADGVLLVLPPRNAACVARMRVINADGSVPEMCGNGVRCVALHLERAAAERSKAARTLNLDTDAGTRACTVEATLDGEQGLVTADMGIVRVLGERSLEVDGKRVKVQVADAGNPHAILFGSFDRNDVERLGPRIATHPEFPRGTNVEFARIAGDGIDLVVWERGVGITLACGTGACATAAVACANGLAPCGAPIAVRLPGGRLDVTLHEPRPERGERGGQRVTMRGPARYVFSGTVARMAREE